MQISFHGAAGTVTGSCHLVTVGNLKILVDCGMFQGGHELKEENVGDFGFDPASIDVLLLTHAHLDHCGRIPLLVNRGFRGDIICTAATRDLARLVILDSAHLHEEEARRRQRHSEKGHKHQPLYDTLDAVMSFDHFNRIADYGVPIRLGHDASAIFYEAGHILGSASILLSVTEDGRNRRILFSGDIGPSDRPFLSNAQPPGDADIIVMETTYGDRDHRSLEASVDELLEAIADTQARGGNVIIPTFALERAQELLFFMNEGIKRDILPQDLRVFLDSPMAISATKIFRNHPEAMTREIAEQIRSGQDPFSLPELEFTRETAESMQLNHIHSGAVIMAGSGMCTGGRVRQHLRHNLAHEESSVIFVGFAAEGTLARIIIDGAQSVKLFGDHIPVRARIHTINGFSAHAGKKELRAWHEKNRTPDITFLIHGEEDARKTFAKGLKSERIEFPTMHQSFEI